MTISRLVLRNLAYHWRSNLAVAFGVAIATAVIVGSLVIGDSVKGSLRESALDRLGRIDQALVVTGYLDATRANDFGEAAPLLITQGVLANDDAGTTVPNVNVIGVDERFARFWPGGFAVPAKGQLVVNAQAAGELGANADSALVLTVPKPGVAPTDSLFARRKRSDLACTLRAATVRVIPDGGPGGFGLDASTTPRRNVFVAREWLAEAIGKPGKANAVAAKGDADLDTPLAKGFRLEDVGLRVVAHGATCDLQSDRLLLTDRELEAAETCGVQGRSVSMYLAPRLKVGGRESSYAVVAAVDGPVSIGLGSNDIAINTWLAQDLGAKIGDRVQAEFLSPRSDGSYGTVAREFRIRRIDSMSLADPTLVPSIEGLTDAPTMGDWDPPFPVDLERITKRDEDYWNRYKAAPKAFVSPATMRELWADQGGYATSYRFDAPADKVEAALKKRLNPRELGLGFRPVRKLALDAAQGSTEYVSLFLGLGMFVIFAAAGLAATLMQLSVARRSGQWGLMLACGISPRRVKALATCEGLAVSGVGALAGGALGIGYASALIAGLRSWWIGAIGTAPLSLHANPLSVAGGIVGGLAVGSLAVALAIRGMLKRTALELVAGPVRTPPAVSVAAPWTDTLRSVPLVLVAIQAVTLVAAGGVISDAVAFFGIGVIVLFEGLLWADFRLRRTKPLRALSLAKMASRNASVNRRHSLLVVGLIACASFTVVAVAPNARSISNSDVYRNDSGAGGFSLMATSAVPLPGDLTSRSGRAALGFTEEDEKAFASADVEPLLMQPGEDASCLNLAKPTNPRVLGVGKRFIVRNRFKVRAVGERANPWDALRAPAAGELPAFADGETATWIFHSGLGKRLSFAGPGKPLDVRLVGLVEKSIFAGDILISADRFKELHPGNDAPRVFLISTPPGGEAKVAEALRRNLGDLGLDVRPTREILSAYLGVQNAYISTFLALGMLGLLLGTVGLATALARNAFDRRKEFAVMLACGIRRGQIARMLLLEHGGLLLAGVLIGTVSALVAGLPLLLRGQSQTNVPLLLASLVGVLAAGWGFCAWSARAASRGDLVPALRSE